MKLGQLLKIIDGFSEWTGRIFSLTIVILVFLVILEVILRRFLNHPTVWNLEVTVQLYAFYFTLLASYTLLHGSHVAIDILYAKFSQRTRAVLDVVTYLVFFFPFLLVVMNEGIKYASASWAVRETSWSVFALPLYPIKTMIPIMAFLLLIQGAANFVRALHVVFGGEEL